MDLEHMQTERLRNFPSPEGLDVEVQKGIQVGGMGRQDQEGTSQRDQHRHALCQQQ